MLRILMLLLLGRWYFHKHEWEAINPQEQNQIIQRCKKCGKISETKYECSHFWETLTNPEDRVLVQKCKKCGEVKRSIIPCQHKWEVVNTNATTHSITGKRINTTVIKECIYCGNERHFEVGVNGSKVYKLDE